MALTDGLNEELFEVAALRLLYYKLFPLFLKDFLTRDDALQMMAEKNLPVTTDPTSGTGTAIPIYRGTIPLGKSKSKEVKYKAAKSTGNITDKVLGGL